MFLGLDLGTGSAKALLMDASGAAVGEGAVPYPVRAPRVGWAESDPGEWLEACAGAVREAVGRRAVSAVGLSGQMHGVVLSDAAGVPLLPAILWADTRSAEMLERYRGLDRRVLETLANPLVSGMAGPSLLWLRDREPETYRAARWALQPKDWLRLRLTGEALSEPSDASATLLYDLARDDWSWPVVEGLGLRSDLLPPLVRSGAMAGELTREAAGLLGLPAGLPVAAGAGDVAAALLGSGLPAGRVQLTVGTGAQIVALANDDRSPAPDPDPRTHLYRTARSDRDHLYRMAAVQNAGLALEWALRVLGVVWEDAYREAFSVPEGANGVTFLPYLSGERTPHLDPHARGAWVGLGLAHGRAHLLRAAFEGVAFALRDGLEALSEAGARTASDEIRLAGGGSAQEPWQRLLADVLGRPLALLPPTVAPNASARGAALLAGLATGHYTSTQETMLLAPETDGIVEPRGDDPYAAPYARYKKLYPRLRGGGWG